MLFFPSQQSLFHYDTNLTEDKPTSEQKSETFTDPLWSRAQCTLAVQKAVSGGPHTSCSSISLLTCLLPDQNLIAGLELNLSSDWVSSAAA